MKIQIDTKKRIIILQDEKTILDELILFLEKILPNGEWKEYYIDVVSGISNINITYPPIIIQEGKKIPWIDYKVYC